MYFIYFGAYHIAKQTLSNKYIQMKENFNKRKEGKEKEKRKERNNLIFQGLQAEF